MATKRKRANAGEVKRRKNPAALRYVVETPKGVELARFATEHAASTEARARAARGEATQVIDDEENMLLSQWDAETPKPAPAPPAPKGGGYGLASAASLAAKRPRKRANPAEVKRRPRARRNGIGAAIVGGVAAGSAGAVASKATETAIAKRERRQRAARVTPKAPRHRMHTTVLRNPSGEPVFDIDPKDCGGLISEESIRRIVIVRPDGSRYTPNADLGTVRAKIVSARLERPQMNATYYPLRRDGKWNDRVRELLKGQTGVYAIRLAGENQPRYVGSSSVGQYTKTQPKARAGKRSLVGRSRDGKARPMDQHRFMRTLLRHFQAGFHPEEGRSEWTHRGGEDVDVALWITPPAKATLDAEDRLIVEIEPTDMNIGKYRARVMDFEREDLEAAPF